MLQINYSKGMYTFTDGARIYTFNINNGECRNANTNVVVRKPPFSKDDMLTCLERSFENIPSGYTNMLQPLYHQISFSGVTACFYGSPEKPISRWLTRLRILDKLINVLPNGCSVSWASDIEDLSNKEFVEVLNFVRTYQKQNTEFECISLNNILRDIELQKLANLFSSYNLPLDFVRNHDYELEQIAKLPDKELALYYYFGQKICDFRMGVHRGWNNRGGLDMLCNYFTWCREIGKTPVKTNNFLREYLETQNSFDLWYEIKQAEQFMANYNRVCSNLTFSYGNYTVVLPTKGQDLITEGNEMHHCVGGYVSSVIKGSTLIVFVRHKDTPDKCYITAQIDPTNGDIGQYFLAYDKHISSQEDIEFKEKFQEWLHSCNWS